MLEIGDLTKSALFGRACPPPVQVQFYDSGPTGGTKPTPNKVFLHADSIFNVFIFFNLLSVVLFFLSRWLEKVSSLAINLSELSALNEIVRTINILFLAMLSEYKLIVANKMCS